MKPHSSSYDAELIILGGGCAGLSLAARILEQEPNFPLLIVEPRTCYEEDRTWCGWRTAPHFFSDCVVSQWEKWRIVTSRGRLQLHSKTYPYELIRASLVYDKAVKVIEDSTGGRLLAGAEAVEVRDAGQYVQVNLADGRILSSSWVVDTRPQLQNLRKPWLWQNFVGYVVACERMTLVSDGIPTLMEFQPAGGAAAQFMYAIPFEDSCVLFECTRFSTVHGETQLLESELNRWLTQRFGDQWRVERRETGSLPMAPPVVQSKQNRVIHAGTRGGSTRISTGYAFHRIQRWADTCCASVLRDGTPVPPQANRLLDAMDELFLRVLQDPSTSAEELFGDLFASCPTDCLVRFLSGIPHASDLWPVVRGLPWGRFIRETPRLAGSWWSRADGVL
jgi:lycopene beta-cyclase